MTNAKYLRTAMSAPTEPVSINTLLPGQVRGAGGGAVFEADKWTVLRRFLILGASTPTYYADQKSLVGMSLDFLDACLKEDPQRVVDEIVAIVQGHRAPRMQPVVAAYAKAVAVGNDQPVVSGDALAARQYALSYFREVLNIPTHLFEFVQHIENSGTHYAQVGETRKQVPGLCGWGKPLRTATQNWYVEKDPRDLAYHVLKYRSRDGMTHRNVLRLAHPKAEGVLNDVLHYAVKGWEGIGEAVPENEALALIWAFEKASRATTVTEIVQLIRDFRLTWEMIDSKWLGDATVWQALLPEMPLNAMVRNLGRLSALGLLNPFTPETKMVTSRLTDPERIKRSRMHPVAFLQALMVYRQGRGVLGSLTWQPNASVVAALDAAFRLAFGNVVPSGVNTLLGLDISSSMGSGAVAGMPLLTPRDASAAMALITAATEPNQVIGGFSYQFQLLPISGKETLTEAISKVSGLPFGSTNGAAMIQWALTNHVPVEHFVAYTDNEINTGYNVPSALRSYREKTGIPAKLTTVALQLNKFTMADPNDGGMLDVCGFDTAAPQLISDFAAGRI